MSIPPLTFSLFRSLTPFPFNIWQKQSHLLGIYCFLDFGLNSIKRLDASLDFEKVARWVRVTHWHLCAGKLVSSRPAVSWSHFQGLQQTEDFGPVDVSVLCGMMRIRLCEPSAVGFLFHSFTSGWVVFVLMKHMVTRLTFQIGQLRRISSAVRFLLV